MTTTLFIIESPGKKKKLEEILGKDYLVRACFGHVRDLPDRGIPFDAPDYKLRYEVKEDRRSTVASLKKDVAGADLVLLATDPDREGEAIAWHLAEVLKLKKAQRVTYHEITTSAVRAALERQRPIDMNLVQAQEARRALDRLIGYEVSDRLSQKAGQSLTAGRVQSPAVRIVVDRERAIRAFVVTDHFGVRLTFQGDAAWSAEWDIAPHLTPPETYMLEKKLAEQAAAVLRVRVANFEDSEARVPPPAPFTTSTLQQQAHIAYKFKPKQTEALAQRLYEQAAITYMATDTPNLSNDAYEAIAAYAKTNQLPVVAERRHWKSKAAAQEAHEAIRPTHFETLDAGETPDEKRLYSLIWRRAVSSQLEDAIYAARKVTLTNLEPLGDGQAPTYVAKGRTLISKGWKILQETSTNDQEGGDDEPGQTIPIPVLEVNSEIDVASGDVLEKSTKPPSRFNLATLVKELEKHGIGRPRTTASILEKITQRAFIGEDAKGLLSATAAGETIVDSLVETFAFIGLEYTRDLEEDLDDVAEGKQRYRDVVAGEHGKLSAELAALGAGSAVHPCPACNLPLRRREGKRGVFWGCSGYPACSTTLADADGSPGAISTRTILTNTPASTAHKCAACKKPLARRICSPEQDTKNGKGYDFFSCTGWPKCKKSYRVNVDGQPIF